MIPDVYTTLGPGKNLFHIHARGKSKERVKNHVQLGGIETKLTIILAVDLCLTQICLLALESGIEEVFTAWWALSRSCQSQYIRRFGSISTVADGWGIGTVENQATYSRHVWPLRRC
jgi:hypothetical protein